MDRDFFSKTIYVKVSLIVYAVINVKYILNIYIIMLWELLLLCFIANLFFEEFTPNLYKTLFQAYRRKLEKQWYQNSIFG